MGSGYCAPSDDQDYAWRASGPTRRHESAWLNYGAVERPNEMLGQKSKGPHYDLGDPPTHAFHVGILFPTRPKCSVFAHRTIQDLEQRA